MSAAFTRTGKQVLLHGDHFADARDEVAASAIVVALNEYPAAIQFIDKLTRADHPAEAEAA